MSSPETNKSLESWIWDEAFSIRGAKDAPKYKDFIFTKRLCDVFDDELNRIAAEVGSRKKAFQLAKRDHKLVRFSCRWSPNRFGPSPATPKSTRLPTCLLQTVRDKTFASMEK